MSSPRLFMSLALVWACRLESDVIAVERDGPLQAGSAGLPDGGAVSVAGATSGGAAGTPSLGGTPPLGGSEPFGGGGSAGAAGSGARCDGYFPSILLQRASGSAEAVCAARAATDRFSNALCACANVDVSGVLSTDAYDSAALTSVPGGAAVGINSLYTEGEYASIDGSLTLSGLGQLRPRGLDVSGDLRVAWTTLAAGPITVGRDAWFRHTVTAPDGSSIGRNLYLDRVGLLDGSSSFTIGGETREAEFEIADACRCEREQLLDIAAIVADAAATNDNASLPLAASQLLDVASPVSLDVACGRYYLDGITGTAPIVLRIEGRVALAVKGSVNADVTVELGPSAELDWFIDGDFAVSARSRLGDAARSAALRVYVRGARAIELTRTGFSGNLYAPSAELVLAGVGDVYGSLFARDLRSAGALAIHYDRAVLAAADACPGSQPASCTGCGECALGSSCVAGACVECNSDSDCCAPLVCDAGACSALLRSGP